MEDLLDQVELGINSKLYYLSLFVSLTIPDLCGALTTFDGKSNKK